MLPGKTRQNNSHYIYPALVALLLLCAYALVGRLDATSAPASRAVLASPLPPVWPHGTALPTETPPPACRPAWRVGSSSNTGPEDNVFNGVAAVSENDVWVVGYYNIGMLAQTLTMHWDGAQWTPVPTPNRGSSTNILSAVVALSSNDVWAVGHYFRNESVTDTLVLHWDGTSWQVVESPNIGSVGNFLTAVSAPPGSGGSDVWAVGQSYDGSSFRTLTEHWNGTQWSIVPSPNPGQNDNRVRGVVAISATDAWAVGYYYAVDDYFTLTMHWNGTNWSMVTSPNMGPGANYLRAVSAVAPGDVWAVGNYSAGGLGPYQTMTMHWDGTQWSMVPSPDPGVANHYLRGLKMLSATDVWAVGYYDNDALRISTLTLHWDGGGWSVVPSPNAGAVNQLYAVSATSAGDAWAVGIWDTTGQYQTLVERYSDPCATPSPTPASPSPTATNTATPTTSPTNSATPTHSPTIAPMHTHTPSETRTSTPAATLTATPAPVPATTTSTPTPAPPSTATSTPCHMAFGDVHSGDYFYEAVRYLYCHWVISGYSDGTFKPYNLTTRGQLSKIVVLAEGWAVSSPSAATFVDVPVDHPFYQYIEIAFSHAIISGYTCGPGCLEFRPGNNITRGQLCKIVVLAEGWTLYLPPAPTFRDVVTGDPFYAQIETAYNHSIISGYDCGERCLEFRPGNTATRGQICKIVYGAAGP